MSVMVGGLVRDFIVSCDCHLRRPTEPDLEKLTFELRSERISQREASHRKWSNIFQEETACEGQWVRELG